MEIVNTHDKHYLVNNLHKLIETIIKDNYLYLHDEIHNENIINYILAMCNHDDAVIEKIILMDHNSIYYIPIHKVTNHMVNIVNKKWKYNIQFEHINSSNPKQGWRNYLNWNK